VALLSRSSISARSSYSGIGPGTPRWFAACPIPWTRRHGFCLLTHPLLAAETKYFFFFYSSSATQFFTQSRFIFSCGDSQNESEKLRVLTHHPIRRYLFNIENDPLPAECPIKMEAIQY
jgi:hypothetical protein